MVWILLFSTVVIVLIINSVFNAKERCIPFGQLEYRKRLKIKDIEYLVEEYRFKDAIESFFYYRRVVFSYSNNPHLKDSKYDLYDWGFTYFQYIGYSFRVMRFGDKLQCVRTSHSVSIEDFEYNSAEIVRLLKTN